MVTHTHAGLFRASAIALACIAIMLTHAPVTAGAAKSHGKKDALTQKAKHSSASDIDSLTWVDHDGQPIPKPPKWETRMYSDFIREGFTEPVTWMFDIPDKVIYCAKAFGADTDREAANVNELDEVPNSTWFTNRNHVRAVPVEEMRRGAYPSKKPAKPWTITHAKQGGRTVGFQIKDAEGTKWLVKLDPLGYPQIISGADRVACTLFHAAGYNVPHNEAVRFQRSDLTIDPDLLAGKEDDAFSEADLDALLAQGATFEDRSFAASASEFLSGTVLGSPNSRRKRPGDANDWYDHTNRRELRGLYVICSWLNSWDTKDKNFLDTFVEVADSSGYVSHYVLDVGASLGASGAGPKSLWHGYEYMVDYGWIARRLVTLGFVEEPWRRAHQETGMPCVGRFTSDRYKPDEFRSILPNPIFDAMTERDGYWGAKIVASFSDAQIRAAVESAGYEDPAASEYVFKTIVDRRNKAVGDWFNRVAPLDFFHVEGDTLLFHDLAVDLRMEEPREYDVQMESEGSGGKSEDRLRLSGTKLALSGFDPGISTLAIELAIAANDAKPTRIELHKSGPQWVVTRVRHG